MVRIMKKHKAKKWSVDAKGRKVWIFNPSLLKQLKKISVEV